MEARVGEMTHDFSSERVTFSAVRAAMRRGVQIARCGRFKRDQAFRVGTMLGYQGSQLDAFIRGFRRLHS